MVRLGSSILHNVLPCSSSILLGYVYPTLNNLCTDTFERIHPIVNQLGKLANSFIQIRLCADQALLNLLGIDDIQCLCFGVY